MENNNQFVKLSSKGYEITMHFVYGKHSHFARFFVNGEEALSMVNIALVHPAFAAILSNPILEITTRHYEWVATTKEGRIFAIEDGKIPNEKYESIFYRDEEGELIHLCLNMDMFLEALSTETFGIK